MNQHPNAWPETPPPRRGLVQIEPHELAPKPLPKGCDYQGRHPEAQHGTECCADTSDEPGQWPEGGFIALLLVVGCVVAALVLAGLLGGI